MSKSRQITVLDMDLTAQGAQVFLANQDYTIGGYVFTKFNTANETNPAVIDNTGLTFSPTSATDYNGSTRTFPGLHLPFFRFIPGFRSDMGVRVWAYNSFGSQVANFDCAVLAVDTNSSSYGYVTKRGLGTTGQGSQTYLGANSVNASGFISDLFTVSSANNVMVLEIPSITGSVWKAYRGGYVNNYWPKIEEMTQHNSYRFNGSVNTTGITPQSLGIVLGAQRAGSANPFVVKFARLRVDLLI